MGLHAMRSAEAGVCRVFRVFARSLGRDGGRLFFSSNRGLISGSIASFPAVGVNGRGYGTKCMQTRYSHSGPKPITCVSRSVAFEDTQFYKVVHGGVCLQLAEEAGDMVVNKYCSREGDDCPEVAVIPVLTKVEKNIFFGSAKVGEILTAEGEVIYTAQYSLRVLVSIFASSVIGSNKRKLMTKCWLWYVLLNASNLNMLLPVQPLRIKDAKQEEEGRIEHEKNVANRKRRQGVESALKMEYNALLGGTSSYIISQAFCELKSFCKAAPVLKWMDEVTGYVAIRYAQTLCVTGECDDINFYSKILPGSYVTLTAMPVFTSSRTLDIQCFVDVETIADGRVTKERAAEAFFTFVTVTKGSKKQLTIPMLTPKTDAEKAIYERRLQIYNQRKAASKSSAS